MPARLATPEMAELEDLKRRRDRAWTDKTVWNGIYGEAWRWLVPYRKPVNGPSGQDRGADRVGHIFDNTGIVSTFRGAGKMHQDLFPPGQAFFRLKPGPVTKAVYRARKKAAGASAGQDQAATQRGIGDNGGPPLDDIETVERQLDDVTEQIQPFFLTGEWDNAVSEMSIDLFVGTGILLILAGGADLPIRFVTLPVDECALEGGPYGEVSALYWKTKMSRRAIKAAFPKGKFPQEFLDALDEQNGSPDDEVALYQDFVQEKKGRFRWKMVVTVDGSEEPVTVQRYRTQPFAAPRYFRVPGETHGRGPALLAVPTVKTLNRTMELALKNFALSMLGIWGYRPGGTFNPDLAKKEPGAFWPMQATGGVMGPDVFRLDTGNGRADLSQIMIGELRTQIQAALHDEQVPDTGATPRSATEWMARMARIKSNYVGAFGRMIHEVIPVVVRRVIEVLYNAGLLTVDLTVDQLLVSIDVISPLAQALKADVHKTTVEAMQVVASLEGPQGVQRRFKLDEIIPEMIKDLGVDSEYVRTATELAAWDDAQRKQAEQAALTSSAIEKPKDWAEALTTATQQPEAA